MPLQFYKSFTGGDIAVWESTESDAFFTKELEAHAFDLSPLENIHHTEKKTQWLASRYLLCEMFPSAIQSYQQSKPTLWNGPSLSFSHSKNMVGVLLSESPAGLDLQWNDPKLLKLATKFTDPTEVERLHFNSDLDTLCLIWAVKESVFKLFGTELPFKNIQINSFDTIDDKVDVEVLRKGINYKISLGVEFIKGFTLAYVMETSKFGPEP